MPTSLFVYQPGDLFYIQVQQGSPVRTFQVQKDGTIREVAGNASGNNWGTDPDATVVRPPSASGATTAIHLPPSGQSRVMRNHPK